MANPLEAWKQHAIASEHMDLTGVGSHQKKGWNFAQNFPALVPGTGVGPAQWVGPTLATGYQLGQEGLRSILPEGFLGGTDIGFVDAMKKGLTEAKQNVQGMGGKGFDKDEYNEWMAAQGYADDGWTIYPDSPITGQNIQRPNITKLIQMSRRRQQLQDFKNIEAKTAAEAAAKAKADADARKKQRMSDKQYDDWRRHNDAGYNKTADEKLAMTGGTEEWGEDMMGGTEAPGNGNVSAETGTDFGPMSHMIARGGLAQHAPRYANGGLIDFYRYGGFI